MKKIFLVAVATGIIGLFNACKKDPANAFKGDSKERMMMSTSVIADGERAYPEYEDYSPLPVIIEERLLLINNCVNKPTEYTMPNMEIQEAVWFLETYFNVGVCAKQEFMLTQYNLRRTYAIVVPFDAACTGNVLKGEILQEAYRNLLHTIVMEICSDNIINFGDVYVQSVSTDNVVLGVEICYGCKTQTSNDPWTWEWNRKFGWKIINDATTIPICNATPTVYTFYNPFPNNQSVNDGVVSGMLNQRYTRDIPTAIKNVWGKYVNSFDYSNDGFRFVYEVITNTSYSSRSTLLYSKDELETFAKIYTEYIYSDLVPSLKHNATPLTGRCDYKTTYDAFGVGFFWHQFGIEFITTSWNCIPATVEPQLKYYEMLHTGVTVAP